MILSKSDYMLFLRHPAWLWLKKFDKHQLPEIDGNTQAIFDTGHEFEEYAEKLFPEGLKLGFNNYDEYNALTRKTKGALDSGAKTIFQGKFEVDGLTCIVDVLNQTDDGVYDLIEIKSSTKVKPEHEYDLAFQLLVLHKAGIKVGNIAVVHVNKEYVKDGLIDPEGITEKTDVTGAVRMLVDITQEQIDKAKQVLSSRQMPDISPRFVNQLEISDTSWFEDWMKIYFSLRPNLDSSSIYHLSYPSSRQIGELEDKGITLIGDVLDELALRPKQLTQIQTSRSNQRVIDKDKIKEFLESFAYPLYFFDYETLSSAIPYFNGGSPYQDYPFQYSLHEQDSPEAEVRHLEYLHAEASNPMLSLLEQLKADIGNSGTILTWNMSYEKGCNQRMAKFYPEYKEFLEGVNERINDLMIPFSKMWLVDKNFFGSASVKKVLPALIPELTYKDLDVSDGLLARRVWTETILMGKNPEQKEKVLSDLSTYCTLDTLAMVRILEVLRKIVYE